MLNEMIIVLVIGAILFSAMCIAIALLIRENERLNLSNDELKNACDSLMRKIKVKDHEKL